MGIKLIKTYFDNAPDEEGVQLILNHQLDAGQAFVIETLPTTEYVVDPDGFWINCGQTDRDAVIKKLHKFGYVAKT